MNSWIYQGIEFTHELAQEKIAEGFIGFIYEITDSSNGMKYIGKKLLLSKRKLQPLKGQKRKRIKLAESDWISYHGSSEIVKEQVELRHADFHREILEFAKTKGVLNYIEMKHQIFKEVLLRRSEYYNGIIAGKINASHLKDLWIN